MTSERQLATIIVLLIGLTMCGGNPTPRSKSIPGRTIVNVTLQEFAVIPALASVHAGAISFQAMNKGPKRVHEFVVVRTSLPQDKLPKNANGSVNEDDATLTSIGEIEKIPVGSTGAKTLTLSAGTYVLFCNVVEKSGSATIVHYKLGMHAAFTVT